MSNGSASARLPAPLPKCEPALRDIYTALGIPPPQPRPPRSELRCEGRALAARPRPQARPASRRPLRASRGGPGLETHTRRVRVEAQGRGAGAAKSPRRCPPGPGRGQNVSIALTWGGPRLQKPKAPHPSPTPTCGPPSYPHLTSPTAPLGHPGAPGPWPRRPQLAASVGELRAVLG